MSALLCRGEDGRPIIVVCCIVQTEVARLIIGEYSITWRGGRKADNV